MRQILNLIFVAVFVLRLRGDEPFSDWSWFETFAPLILSVILSGLKHLWEQVGAIDKIRGEFALMRYDYLLKRAVNKAKKDIENAKRN